MGHTRTTAFPALVSEVLMLKRLASLAAASILAGAALFGSGATSATAGHNWETKVSVPGSGDLTQKTSGHNWE
jgi:hypothetical protein